MVTERVAYPTPPRNGLGFVWMGLQAPRIQLLALNLTIFRGNVFLYLMQPPEKLYKTAGMSTLSKTDERKTQKKEKSWSENFSGNLVPPPTLTFFSRDDLNDWDDWCHIIVSLASKTRGEWWLAMFLGQIIEFLRVFRKQRCPPYTAEGQWLKTASIPPFRESKQMTEK